METTKKSPYLRTPHRQEIGKIFACMTAISIFYCNFALKPFNITGMKKLLFLLFLCTHLSSCAQKFTCPELKKDISEWNKVKKSSNFQEWANEIKDKRLYKQNATGALEYAYVISTTSHVEMNILRELALDYLCRYFKINNSMRASIDRNSPKDRILFTASIPELAIFYTLIDENRVDSKVDFDIRFRENRVRFCVKIEKFHIKQISSKKVYEDKMVHVRNAYPLNRKSDHKDSYSKAFINANSKCLNYANQFLDFFNKHAKAKFEEENW